MGADLVEEAFQLVQHIQLEGIIHVGRIAFDDRRFVHFLGISVGQILHIGGCQLDMAAICEQAQLHTEVGAKLWGAREALLSLLVDLQDGRPVEEVRQQRDRLNAELEDIYKAAPRTNSKAYSDAQEALKNAEELFFTDEELNKMLPKQLRSNAGTTT